MPILRVESPADVLPFGIEPQSTRLWRQTGSTRIAANVLNDSIQMLFITEDPVVALLLPEFPRALRGRVDVFGDDGLHRSQQVFQFVFWKRPDHQMTVVQRDDRTGDINQGASGEPHAVRLRVR